MPKGKKRISIDDLPQDAARHLSEEDMKRVSGGYTLLSSDFTSQLDRVKPVPALPVGELFSFNPAFKS